LRGDTAVLCGLCGAVGWWVVLFCFCLFLFVFVCFCLFFFGIRHHQRCVHPRGAPVCSGVFSIPLPAALCLSISVALPYKIAQNQKQK